MINSFQSLNTLTSGLQLLQLEEQTNATNLSQPSVDSQGYLINSLQQVNSVNDPSIDFTGANGLLSVGTGASAESITRLRSSYLDSQIQQQSMAVGYDEVLSNSTSSGIMDQIKTFVDGTTTLSSALNSFQTAWTKLASDPTSSSLQSGVVSAGEAFASTATSEYDQLQSLQLSTNNQISQTVSQVNQYLNQLASINGQISASGSTNDNSLLDERDYTLDKLSRLMNFQVNYNSNGTANLWLNDVELVSGTNASSLMMTTENPNNPQLVDITVANSGGIFSDEDDKTGVITQVDVTSEITGGNLGGEIYGRNVLLQSYKEQVQQVTSQVINLTNGIYSAGYIANSDTTGVNFFTGTGANDILVNGSLVNTPTTLATETQETATPATGTAPLPSGQLATFLSELPNLLNNSYITSTAAIGSVGATIDPTQSISSQISGAGTSGGSFYLNGTLISYTASDSINDILTEINSNSSTTGVYAVFNANAKTFSFYSANAVTINEGAGSGDQFGWANVQSVLVGYQSMVDPSAPDPFLNIDFQNSALNSNQVTPAAPPLPSYGPNSQAFFVTPSTTGSFTINYTDANGLPASVTINWDNGQILQTDILDNLPSYLNDIQIGPTGNGIEITTNSSQQYISTISIVDNSGNFTQFTGLSGTGSLSNVAQDVSQNAASQQSSYASAYTTSSNLLTQLNNQQDNLAGVSGTYTVNNQTQTVGVSTNTVEQQAYTEMVQYNAMLEVMQVIDQMLDALVGISSSSSTNGIFQQQSSS